MKKILTIAVYSESAINDSLFEKLEFIFAQENESCVAFTARCAKTAKGKYIIVADKKFTLADAHNFCELVENATADMLVFNGGAAYKTAVFKGIDFKLCFDAFSVNALCCLNAKSLQKTEITPLRYREAYSQFDCEAIESICEEFQKVKAKLNKDVYNYSFDYICHKLLSFYLYAMLASREGTFEREKLVEFDNRLKQTIVLYLAVEKKFPVSKLQKFRDKGFKISYFAARKLKKTRL